MAESICENCPFKVAYDLAEVMLEEQEDFHASSESQLAAALGGLTFTRESHQQVAQQIGCDGPSKNGGEQVVCPLEATVKDVRLFMEGPNAAQRTHYNYEVFAANEVNSTSTNGNYL